MTVNYPLEALRYREPGVSNYVIIGQQPSGNEPDNPLSAQNPVWSGARLARMGSMSPDDFEAHFKRVNINYERAAKFHVNQITRSKAKEIWSVLRPNDRVIFLGSAVVKCFAGFLPSRLIVEPFATDIARNGMKMAVIPHPSGLNRYYNSPTNVAEVGRFLNRCYNEGWIDESPNGKRTS